MTFISYSQNFEDVMLHRALKDVEWGFYIDVGANDPIIDSVTKAFYDAGWRGINIEPVKQWYEKLQQDRPEDINLQIAVGARKGNINFYEVVDTGLSTMDESIAKRHAREHGYGLEKYKVPAVRLTTICEQYPQEEIHFLKIDVEGAEGAVLKGLNLKKIRPWIVLVESTLPNTQMEDYKGWEPFLTEFGYHYVYFDGLNRYYVADEHKNLDSSFILPPNIFDCFKPATEEFLEHHVEYLQSEWGSAKDQSNKAKEAAEQQYQQLEVQLLALRTDACYREEKLQEKEAKLQEAAVLLTDSKQQVVKLQTSLDDSLKQHQQLEIQLQTLQEKEDSIDWLNNEWSAAKQQIAELHQSNHHWWLEADRLNTEIQTIYSGTFWRITWPLRKLMLFLKCLSAQPAQLLSRAISFVLLRQGLKSKAKALISRFPSFNIKLIEFAQARGLFQSRPESVSDQIHPECIEPRSISDFVEISKLTPHAHRIYLELKIAIEKKVQGRSQ